MRRTQLFFCLAVLLPSCTSTLPDCATKTEVTEVRAQLERAYAANEAAFARRDVGAIMALRHPSFHTVDRNGKVSTRQDMQERTRAFIARIERFDSQRETIRALEVHGDTAIVRVFQELSRTQRLGDGALHQVETTVTQREWWRCTADGWRLWRVDDEDEGTLLIDGRPPK